MSRRSLHNIRNEIARKQAAVRPAVIGRPLQIPTEAALNAHIDFPATDRIRYDAIGQKALVYLLRGSTDNHSGISLYDRSTFEKAIVEAPLSGRAPARIKRSDLTVVRKSFDTVADGRKRYWLTSLAMAAFTRWPNSPPVDLKDEERCIARNIQLEGQDTSGKPELWLGAVTAPDYHTATLVMNQLEAVIPRVIDARSISVVHADRTS